MPVARSRGSKEIFRQVEPAYKEAVAAIAEGNAVGGLDGSRPMGWVKEMPEAGRHDGLVDAYVDSLAEARPERW